MSVIWPHDGGHDGRRDRQYERLRRCDILEETMNSFETLCLSKGQVAFEGTIRCDDIGVREFRIDLPNKPSLYGEWNPSFAADGYDFDIEIISFGFVDKYSVGNKNPDAKLAIDGETCAIVMDLISALFSDTSRRKDISPFTADKAKFTDRLIFVPGWALSQDQ